MRISKGQLKWTVEQFGDKVWFGHEEAGERMNIRQRMLNMDARQALWPILLYSIALVD